jgi:uncharacterized protein Yka (UPF0111/DUF47 family)
MAALAAEHGVAYTAPPPPVRRKPRKVTPPREVKRIEAEGDAVYHEAMGVLFAGRPDPLDVMKWKEIYDTIEETLDRCQTVAIVLESISLKNS